ncbi:MAG: transglutaminase family protein, partial [Pseudomonadota bacterium]|nr:transglutaminase family protein [Pseudomonadota bacterium]
MTALRILHSTRYAYGAPAAFSQHLLRLTPPSNDEQRVLSAEVTVSPRPQERAGFVDAFGNRLETATVTEPHETLEITLRCVVERLEREEPMLGASTPWEQVARIAAGPTGLHAALYAYPTPLTDADAEIEAYALPSFEPGRPVLEAARELCSRIHDDFKYLPGATNAETPANASFAAREGVCQDFAHVMLAAMRALRLPCAYVSGYLRTLPPPGKARLVGADATHAWASVWDPSVGWVQFDPTNDMQPGADHVMSASGRDYADCAPVTGLVVGSGGQMLSVSVDVASLEELEEARDAALIPAPRP